MANYAGALRKKQASRNADPSSPSTGHLATLVNLIQESATLMVAEMVHRLNQSGYHDTTASHHFVFGFVDRQGTRLTELAARSSMTHQSMGELVGQLERGGYVERRPDPTDGRSRLVCLTPKGRVYTKDGLRIYAEIEAVWAERLGYPNADELFERFSRAVEIAHREGFGDVKPVAPRTPRRPSRAPDHLRGDGPPAPPRPPGSGPRK